MTKGEPAEYEDEPRYAINEFYQWQEGQGGIEEEVEAIEESNMNTFIATGKEAGAQKGGKERAGKEEKGRAETVRVAVFHCPRRCATTAGSKDM